MNDEEFNNYCAEYEYELKRNFLMSFPHDVLRDFILSHDDYVTDLFFKTFERSFEDYLNEERNIKKVTE